MGLRFRKSFKIAPGVRFNVNKKSVGMSFGIKGARVSINSKGKKTTTVGIPGTGLYYTTTSSIKSDKRYRNSEELDKEIFNYVKTLPTNIVLVKGNRKKNVQTRGFSWYTFVLGPLYFIGRAQFLIAFSLLLFDIGFLFVGKYYLILFLHLLLAFFSKRGIVYKMIKKGWLPVLPEETINN